MSDRPDWLPEPERPPSRPVGERLRLAAANVVSLFVFALGMVELMLAVTTVIAMVAPGGNRPSARNVLGHVVGAGVCLVVAYLLRWCLHYARIGLKSSPAKSAN